MLDAMPGATTSTAPTTTLILGGGPIGLAAAAHLALRGQSFRLLEAGGDIAASVQQWAHVKLFSPWRFNIDAAAASLLAETGWVMPDPEMIPSGNELIDRYLGPLARHPSIAPHIQLNTRAKAVSRAGADKVRTTHGLTQQFNVLAVTPRGEEIFEADFVLDATGTWGSPNPMGGDGIEAAGETQAGARLFYGLPNLLGDDADRYRGRHTAVVGSGLSAATALVGLSELADQDPETRISWIIRGTARENLFGGGSRDELPARGQLGSKLGQLARDRRLTLIDQFRIRAIEGHGATLLLDGVKAGRHHSAGPFDEIIVATGQRPDLSLTRELRLAIEPRLESVAALARLIDPNLHYCGSVEPHGYLHLSHAEEPGFFVLGAKSYGRAPSFLMATGYEQVRSVVAGLVGDMVAASAVKLKLPSTGICSTDMPGCCATSREPSRAEPSGAGACCGEAAAPAAATVSSCCGAAPTPELTTASSCCGPSTSSTEMAKPQPVTLPVASWSRQALMLAASRQRKPRETSGSCCG